MRIFSRKKCHPETKTRFYISFPWLLSLFLASLHGSQYSRVKPHIISVVRILSITKTEYEQQYVEGSSPAKGLNASALGRKKKLKEKDHRIIES